MRVALQPVTDRRPICVFLLHHAHFDQHVADGRVGPVVRAVEAKRHRAAFGELDATTALDLDLEQADGILDVGNLQPLAFQCALLDFRTGEIGLVGQIGWPAIDRDGEQARRCLAAAHFGLEVAGELARRLDHERPEIRLEEEAGGPVVTDLDGGAGIADALPFGGGDGLFAAIGHDPDVGAGGQLGAGAAEGGKRLAMLFVGPAGDLVEGDRRHRHTLLRRTGSAALARRQQNGDG